LDWELRWRRGKVKGVLDWLTPKGVKDIQKFLGLANYYQWFIKYFTSIAKLLERFTKEPVLAAPDLDKKMRMEVNALDYDYATGEVLSIECENG